VSCNYNVFSVNLCTAHDTPQLRALYYNLAGMCVAKIENSGKHTLKRRSHSCTTLTAFLRVRVVQIANRRVKARLPALSILTTHLPARLQHSTRSRAAPGAPHRFIKNRLQYYFIYFSNQLIMVLVYMSQSCKSLRIDSSSIRMNLFARLLK